MLNTELKKRGKQSLRQTIKGGAITPYGWIQEWQSAYLQRNEGKIVKILKQNRAGIRLIARFLPAPVKFAIEVILSFPEGSLEFRKAMDTLLSYSPGSLLGL